GPGPAGRRRLPRGAGHDRRGVRACGRAHHREPAQLTSDTPGILCETEPMPRTRVPLVRHGEVHNPEGILYGRLDGYRLSERGRAMAQRLAEHFTGPGFDVVHLVASPLQRAQETIEPLSRALDIPVCTDERVIEADSVFEGLDLAPNPRQLAHPRPWKHLLNPFVPSCGEPYREQERVEQVRPVARVREHLLNPFVPSWGEPYREQVARMTDAIRVARAAAEGHDAVIVSHQSPIWMTRLALEGRSVLHDPRRRQCTLASVTTLTFDGATLVGLDYSEPAADLLVGAVAIT